MPDAEKLARVKLLLEEDGDARALTDDLLRALLDQTGGDVNRAIYLGALRKARVDSVTLPDGTSLPSNRPYWLTIAATYRANKNGVAVRADQPSSEA